MVKQEGKPKYHHRCGEGCSISQRKLLRPSTQDLINRKLPDACICDIFSRLEETQDLLSCAAVCWSWADLLLSLSTPMLFRESRDFVLLTGRSVDDTQLVTEVINASFERNSVTDLFVSGWSSSSKKTVCVPMVTDRGIEFVTNVCRNLKSVRLEGCPLITDRSMEVIAASCSALESLYLCGNSSVTVDGITEIAARCANLSSIHIEDCPSVASSKLLRAMVEHAKKLTTVSLRRCGPDWTPISNNAMAAGTPDLVAAKQEGMKSDAFLPADAGFDESAAGVIIHGLENLVLIECDGLDVLLAHVQFPMVKRVMIQGCSVLDHEIDLINLLGPSTALETLELGTFSFPSYANLMEVLSMCHGTIKHLVMEHCTVQEASPSTADVGIVRERCPELERIKLRYCESIVGVLLQWISAACHEVKELSLVGMPSTPSSWNPYLGGGGGTIPVDPFTVAFRCRSITKLDLSRSGADDVFVKKVVSLLGSTLEELVLDGSPQFEADCGASIAKHCPGLVRLSLSGTSIVDRTLKLLLSRGFIRLKELVFERCHGLTDEALKVLFSADLRWLRRLNFRGCRGITPNKVALFGNLWTIEY